MLNRILLIYSIVVVLIAYIQKDLMLLIFLIPIFIQKLLTEHKKKELKKMENGVKFLKKIESLSDEKGTIDMKKNKKEVKNAIDEFENDIFKDGII